MKKHTLAALALLAIPGCADTMVSDSRLQGVLGNALNDPNAVISNRRFDGFTNTYASVKTNHGTYSCTINGGGVAAMGIINPPVCTPTGGATMSETIKPASTQAQRPVSQAQRDAARSHVRTVQNTSATENQQRVQAAAAKSPELSR